MKLFKLLILLVYSLCFSQGGNNLRIEYNETISNNSQIKTKKLASLYITKDISYYQIVSTKFEKKESKVDSDIIIINSKKTNEISEIFVDFKNKKLIERLYENLFLKKKYAVNESIPIMKWKILEDEKKIKNYLCKKAQITFRGRTYFAWFTEKIPISSGPWKFNGLPGLILSISDKEGMYKWDAKSITYPYKGSQVDYKKIVAENPKYKSITFKEFDNLRINAIKNKIETIKARNSNREGMYGLYSYTTAEEKEPINEFRTKKDFQ